ncbi:MAG: hypothetical protein FWG89_05320 [Treponema sp.]|nr:hypothetical protein [Treponema sp.]
MNKIYSGIFGAVILASLMLLGACNIADSDTADRRFDGAWVALSGVRLEFNRGNYTRTPVLGEEQTGTFTIDGKTITFYQSGYSPESWEFTLNFPALTIGPITYYRDMDTLPDELRRSGEYSRWVRYVDTGIQSLTATIFEFRTTEPIRGYPNVLEGQVLQYSFFRGTYTLRSHAVPGTNVLTMNITHMNGVDLSMFINSNLIQLESRFDPEALRPPAGMDISDWWVTAVEVERIFETAASRIGTTLQEQTQITNAMRSYLSIMQTPYIYEYTLEADPLLVENHRTAADGINKLTMRSEDGNTYTYMLINETSWDFEYPDGTSTGFLTITDPADITIVDGVRTGADIQQGGTRDFTLEFVDQEPPHWPSTWTWPPEPGTYEVFWRVSPWDWAQFPNGIVQFTNMTVDPANPLLATLNVGYAEVLAPIRVEVFVSLFDRVGNMTVKFNITPFP